MGASINLPVMLNQAPHVQKVQHAEQSHPEQQQVLVGQEAVEKQKLERHKVQLSEKSEGGLTVRRDGKDTRQEMSSQNRDKEKKEAEETEEATPRLPEETNSGRLINMHV